MKYLLLIYSNEAQRAALATDPAPIFEEVEKLISTGVPAACDQGEALCRKLLAPSKRGCQRRRTRRFDQVARRLDHQHLRCPNLVVAHEHEVIQPLPENPLRELEGGAGGEALGEGLHPILDQPAYDRDAIHGRHSKRLRSGRTFSSRRT